MAKPLSNDDVMGNGLAAYALASSMLKYLEHIGVPRHGVVRIMEMAILSMEHAAKVDPHPAHQAAVRQLRDGMKKLKAAPTAEGTSH